MSPTYRIVAPIQGRLISWAPERKPGTQANFTDRVLVAPRNVGTVPGYPADLPVGRSVCFVVAQSHSYNLIKGDTWCMQLAWQAVSADACLPAYGDAGMMAWTTSPLGDHLSG